MKARTVLYCLVGGLALTPAARGAGHFGWWWLSGVVLAASFLPVAWFGPRGFLGQMGVIAPVLLGVTVLCTWSEALLFMPGFGERALQDLAGASFLYLVVAAVLAFLARFLQREAPPGPAPDRRPLPAVAGLVLVCGAAYVLYYLVFGALTYEFFTKPYYPDAPQAVARLGLWFWAIQLGRGVLMTLAVLPAVHTLRLDRRAAAAVLAGLVWIPGGLAPLLVPNDYMGGLLRFIHIAEILSQNACLGVTAALLLRPRPEPRPGNRGASLVGADI